MGVSKIDRFSPQAIHGRTHFAKKMICISKLSDEISLLKNRKIMRRKELFCL